MKKNDSWKQNETDGFSKNSNFRSFFQLKLHETCKKKITYFDVFKCRLHSLFPIYMMELFLKFGECRKSNFKNFKDFLMKILKFWQTVITINTRNNHERIAPLTI